MADRCPHLASVGMDDFEKSISLSDGAIKSAPCHFLLHNNKAFGLASLGRVGEARSELTRFPKNIDETDKAILFATTGLICYREGRVMEGSVLYEKSISLLKRHGDHKPFLSAAFWLREELLISGENRDRAFAIAKEHFKMVTDPAAKRLWKRLKQDYERSKSIRS